MPGPAGTTAAAAALLAVGALAVLAGHTWGLLVSVPSHVTLVGRVWPTLGDATTASTPQVGATAIVLVTALPAMALIAFVLPQMARHLFPDRAPRTRALIVAASAMMLAAALVVPAIIP
jgi:hypothetical protein